MFFLNQDSYHVESLIFFFISLFILQLKILFQSDLDLDYKLEHKYMQNLIHSFFIKQLYFCEHSNYPCKYKYHRRNIMHEVNQEMIKTSICLQTF